VRWLKSIPSSKGKTKPFNIGCKSYNFLPVSVWTHLLHLRKLTHLGLDPYPLTSIFKSSLTPHVANSKVSNSRIKIEHINIPLLFLENFRTIVTKKAEILFLCIFSLEIISFHHLGLHIRPFFLGLYPVLRWIFIEWTLNIMNMQMTHKFYFQASSELSNIHLTITLMSSCR
jgi:hypothetical protein